jgi:hypothetical protein
MTLMSDQLKCFNLAGQAKLLQLQQIVSTLQFWHVKPIHDVRSSLVMFLPRPEPRRCQSHSFLEVHFKSHVSNIHLILIRPIKSMTITFPATVDKYLIHMMLVAR